MIKKDMLIIDLLQLEKNNELAAVLQSNGMHCLGCIMAHGETIEQAAGGHGIDVDVLISQLNSVL